MAIILALNINWIKCMKLLFHRRQKNLHEEFKTTCISKDEIPKVTHLKYIGLSLDANLTQKLHTNNICSVLVRHYSMVYNIRNSITSNISRAHTFCLHLSTYIVNHWYMWICQWYVDIKLQVQQNMLLKLLTKRNYRYSTNELQQENRILHVKHIHELYTLVFVYCCHNDTSIEPLKIILKGGGDR